MTIDVTAVNDVPIAVNDTPWLSFDGVDDYVAVADSASLQMSNTMTIEAWVKPTTSASTELMIVNKEGEYEVALLPDGTIQWAFGNTSPGWNWHDTGYQVTLDEWSHIAVTYDNGTVSTFVNGASVDTYNGWLARLATITHCSTSCGLADARITPVESILRAKSTTFAFGTWCALKTRSSPTSTSN